MKNSFKNVTEQEVNRITEFFRIISGVDIRDYDIEIVDNADAGYLAMCSEEGIISMSKHAGAFELVHELVHWFQLVMSKSFIIETGSILTDTGIERISLKEIIDFDDRHETYINRRIEVEARIISYLYRCYVGFQPVDPRYSFVDGGYDYWVDDIIGDHSWNIYNLCSKVYEFISNHLELEDTTDFFVDMIEDALSEIDKDESSSYAIQKDKQRIREIKEREAELKDNNIASLRERIERKKRELEEDIKRLSILESGL